MEYDFTSVCIPRRAKLLGTARFKEPRGTFTRRGSSKRGMMTLRLFTTVFQTICTGWPCSACFLRTKVWICPGQEFLFRASHTMADNLTHVGAFNFPSCTTLQKPRLAISRRTSHSRRKRSTPSSAEPCRTLFRKCYMELQKSERGLKVYGRFAHLADLHHPAPRLNPLIGVREAGNT
jgi:hypothetical protein